MADLTEGLFGPTPWQVQQAQQQVLQSAANNYANQTPLQRAAAGMFNVGGQVGSAVAPMLGMVNPAVQQAQQQQDALQGADLQTPAGLREAAKKMLAIGNQRGAYLLGQKAHEIEKEEAATKLAQQKQDEAEQFRRDQLAQAADLKKMQLEQTLEAARLRSEDTRYSADQRREAAAEATAARLQLGQLMAEIKRLGIEAKQGQSGQLTPAQALKQQQAQAKSAGALRGMDTTLQNMTDQANDIANHPGLSRATGVMGQLPSYPGGDASKVENLIEEFKASVKKAGLDLARQGGSIGSMTEREWPIVEGMVASVNPKAGEQAVKDQMQKVLMKVDQIRRNAYQTHNESFDGSLTPADIKAPTAATPTPAAQAPIYATNGKVRIMSTDGGKTWKPAGAK